MWSSYEGRHASSPRSRGWSSYYEGYNPNDKPRNQPYSAYKRYNPSDYPLYQPYSSTERYMYEPCSYRSQGGWGSWYEDCNPSVEPRNQPYSAYGKNHPNDKPRSHPYSPSKRYDPRDYPLYQPYSYTDSYDANDKPRNQLHSSFKKYYPSDYPLCQPYSYTERYDPSSPRHQGWSPCYDGRNPLGQTTTPAWRGSEETETTAATTRTNSTNQSMYTNNPRLLTSSTKTTWSSSFPATKPETATASKPAPSFYRSSHDNSNSCKSECLIRNAQERVLRRHSQLIDDKFDLKQLDGSVITEERPDGTIIERHIKVMWDRKRKISKDQLTKDHKIVAVDVEWRATRESTSKETTRKSNRRAKLDAEAQGLIGAFPTRALHALEDKRGATEPSALLAKRGVTPTELTALLTRQSVTPAELNTLGTKRSAAPLPKKYNASTPVKLTALPTKRSATPLPKKYSISSIKRNPLSKKFNPLSARFNPFRGVSHCSKV